MATVQENDKRNVVATEKPKTVEYRYSSKSNIRLYVAGRHAILEMDGSNERTLACLIRPDLARRLSEVLQAAADEIEHNQVADKQIGCG
jgi:hypothetical protein